jgi:DNA gyrase/topoisomerase IV, subunit A
VRLCGVKTHPFDARRLYLCSPVDALLLTCGLETRPVLFAQPLSHCGSVSACADVRVCPPQELILFSRADLERSIPSMVDGLKPGQRKIMFSCFKRNLKDDIKVRSNWHGGHQQRHMPLRFEVPPRNAGAATNTGYLQGCWLAPQHEPACWHS